jgi:hypothetical protein
MKKLLIIAFAVASLATAFTSCKKDVSEEELLKNQFAQADSLLKRGGVIKYTVKVVSTANSSMLKSKMSIENASVTVYQNDKVFTGQTDAMGFVTFPDMRVGTVAVNVTLKDHAEVDYVADITPQEQLTNLSQSQVVNTIRYASTMVPMFPIADPGCATITGKVTAELDLTNTTPEPAPGVKVTAIVDVDDPDFVSRYIAPTLSSSTPSAGRILKYAFSDATITATTDAQGVYTLKVPASINGLPIKLSIGDYQATQKLYLENDPSDGTFNPREYTLPVLFSSNVEPTSIPVVKPVYVVLDEPTAPIGIIYKTAKFDVTLDTDGGIKKVDVLEKGQYSSKPAIVVTGYGSGAEIEALFNTTTGEIEGVKINQPGKGYISTLNLLLKCTLVKTRINAVIELDITTGGYIFNTKLTNKGFGFIQQATAKILSPNSNAITPILKLNMNYWNGEIGSIDLLKEGSGFKNLLNYPVLMKQIDNMKNGFILTTGNIYYRNIYIGTGKTMTN